MSLDESSHNKQQTRNEKADAHSDPNPEDAEMAEDKDDTMSKSLNTNVEETQRGSKTATLLSSQQFLSPWLSQSDLASNRVTPGESSRSQVGPHQKGNL